LKINPKKKSTRFGSLRQLWHASFSARKRLERWSNGVLE
jgi:hypothetical protein